MDRFTSLAVVRRRHAGAQAMRGGAMVEFALVLPLLLLIVFGVVGFSVALLDKVVMTNATREAARQGTTFRGVNLRPSLADVQKVATDFCTANLIDFGTRSGCTATVTPDPATLVSGNQLTVKVQHTFTFLGLVGFINPFGSANGVVLQASTVMRAE